MAPPPSGDRQDEDLGYGDREGPESQGAFAGDGFGRTAGGAFGDEDRDPSYEQEAPPLAPDDLAAGTAEGPRPDEGIAEEVAERLTDAFGLAPDDVAVRVDDGVVTLAGAVDDEPTRDAIEAETRAVPGVRAVENTLTLRTPEP